MLDTRKCKVDEKHGLHLTQWLCALRDNGFKPKYFFTDKDFAEVNAIRSTWPDGTVQPKLCLWHALRAIKKHILATSYTKTQKEALQQQVREGEAIEHVEPNAHNNLNMNNDSEPFRIPTIQRAALPEYLH